MTGRRQIIPLVGCFLLLVTTVASCTWPTIIPTPTATPPPTLTPPSTQAPERTLPSTQTPTPTPTSATLAYQGRFDIKASTVSYIAVGFGDAMLLSVAASVPFEITLTEAYEGGPLTGETEVNIIWQGSWNARETLPVEKSVTGTTTGEGRVRVSGRFDPATPEEVLIDLDEGDFTQHAVTLGITTPQAEISDNLKLQIPSGSKNLPYAAIFDAEERGLGIFKATGDSVTFNASGNQLGVMGRNQIGADGEWTITATLTPLEVPTPTALLPTTPSTPTTTLMKLYRDVVHGFSISYPQGWREEPPLAVEGAVFKVSAPERLPTVEVYQIQVKAGQTAAQAFPDVMAAQPKYGGDVKLISAGDVVLKDGTLAYAFVQSGRWQELEDGVGKTLLVVAGGTKGFIISGYTTSDLYDEYESLIDEVIYSFSLIQIS